MNKAETIAGQIDALAALRAEKEQVKARINVSGQEIGKITQQILSPVPAATSGIVGIGSLVSNGIAVYQGIRLGTRILRSVLSIFHRRK